MSTEDAKGQFLHAEELYKAGRFEESLAILDTLQRALATSRRVIYQRALCLISLARLDEALACCDALEGKLDANHINVLRDKIARERRISEARSAPSPADEPRPAAPTPVPVKDKKPASAPSQNVFQVEAVFPLSTDRTTVTGRVVQGAFYSNDMVSVLSAGSPPVMAQIVRLGSAETPIRVVRQGQQSMMVLGIEPQHVAVGARLTSASTSEAYAETMVVSSDEEAMGVAPEGIRVPPELAEAEALLDNRMFGPAKEQIDAYLNREPANGAAHRLLARVHLEADDELQDASRALECIQKAYELKGDKDPAVLETLAKALGAAGRAAQGIRYLERLYSLAANEEESEALAKRIESYRTQFRLGNVWEFMNNWNDVVFESGSIDDIEKALANGSIPKDAKCRQNKTGEWRTIQDELLPKYPQLAVFYTAPRSAVPRSLGLGAFAGLVIGVIGGLFIPGLRGNAAVVIGVALAAVAVGAGIGALGGVQADNKSKAQSRKRAR